MFTPIETLDWRALPHEEQQRRINNIESKSRPFNLERGPVIRATLIWLNGMQEAILYLEASHIAADVKSLRYIIDDLVFYYHSCMPGSEEKILALPVHDRDYVSWFSKEKDSQSYQKAIEYWGEKLENVPRMLHLPTDMPRNKESFKGSAHSFNIPVTTKSAVEHFAKMNDTTPPVVLITVFAVLLHKYSRDKTINIGAPASVDSLSTIRKRDILFQDSLVFFSDFMEDQSFIELVAQNKKTMLDDGGHQAISFDDVVALLGVTMNSTSHPVYQVSFNFQPDIVQKSKAGLVDFEIIAVDSGYNNLDIDLALIENDSGYVARLKYNANLFHENTIERFSQYFTILIEMLMKAPLKKISEVSLLTSKERNLVIHDWNKTDQDFPLDKCVMELFEEKVSHYPDKKAVVFDDIALTYSELNKKVNRLARYLLQFDLKADDLVGVCLPRSQHIIISELAVMKAGAAFVPLDPTLPPERLSYIAKDSEFKCLLTLGDLTNLFPAYDGDLVCLDSDEEAMMKLKQDNLDLRYSSENLAYVIYTSGSTGNPKGVLIQHEGLTNFLLSSLEAPGLEKDDVLLSLTTISFDIAIFELFWPLMCGASVVIAPEIARQDMSLLEDLIRKQSVSTMIATPTTWMMLFENGWKADKNFTAISAGEAISLQMAKRLSVSCKALWNGYGPTEITCGSSFAQIQEHDEYVSIGRPIANKKYYILDGNLNPVPIGVPGELFISGIGLARGYLNRPKLSNEKFIQDPFQKKSGERIYKTGDLCCWLPDGRVRYLERLDFQVKVRGHRVELGEIESKLNMHEYVKESVVVVKQKPSGDKFLVAYFLSASKNKKLIAGWAKSLSAYLISLLPQHMVPDAFVLLDKFPLTSNGKLDRAALPEGEYEISEAIIAPKTALQKKIVEVWSNVLNMPIEKISVSSNFFLTGGSSLSMVMMFSELRKQLKKEPNVEEFLSSPTVSVLSEQLSDSEFDVKISSHPELIAEIKTDIEQMEAITALAKINDYCFQPRAVLLTGAYGFLGSYLANAIFENTAAVIYCVVRAGNLADAKRKLNEAFNKGGHNHLINHARIQVVLGDLKQDKLGLEATIYQRLVKEVDAIYHCGALVHHLYDYERLRKTNVHSTLQLLTFATSEQNKAIHFISTIATEGLSFDRDSIAKNTDWSGFAGNGYVLTKWVSEQLMQIAAQKGILAKVYRPGNISSDSKSGYCQYQSNHVLLKLKGMLQLEEGYISDDDILEMVPVDVLSEDIVNKSLDGDDGNVIYNVHNPETISWQEFLQAYEAHGFKVQYFNDLDRWHRIIENLDISNAMYPLLELYRTGHIQEESKVLNNRSDLAANLPSYNRMIEAQINYLIKMRFFQ